MCKFVFTYPKIDNLIYIQKKYRGKGERGEERRGGEEREEGGEEREEGGEERERESS
jgi:hypothetical protein